MILALLSFKAITSHLAQFTEDMRSGRDKKYTDSQKQGELCSKAAHSWSLDVSYHVGRTLTGHSEPSFYSLNCYLFIAKLTNLSLLF